jgi:shikimate dehydrogenase
VPPRPQILLDVTYHPWPTALARAWQGAGGTAVPGSQMLLWQAVEQVELMTGLAPPVAAMAEALHAALTG